MAFYKTPHMYYHMEPISKIMFYMEKHVFIHFLFLTKA